VIVCFVQRRQWEAQIGKYAKSDRDFLAIHVKYNYQ